MNKAYISQVFQRQMEQMRNIKNLIFDNDAMGELPPQRTSTNGIGGSS